jgi:hypothetical protein
MSRPERMITPGEVRTVVLSGDLIEDYPQDPRGHSCLLLDFGDNNRAVHVVCSPKDEYLAIITAYLPDPVQILEGGNKVWNAYIAKVGWFAARLHLAWTGMGIT